jgi:hypothetical protein
MTAQRKSLQKPAKMPLGERRHAAFRKAGRLRVAAGMNRWLTTKGCSRGQAAVLGSAMTVMIQRVGLPDLTSMTERTTPVTNDPSTVNAVF